MPASVKVGGDFCLVWSEPDCRLALENDTLARIGTSCFQQLLENNVKKLSPSKWERIVTAFVQLFQTTTAYQLFDETLRSDKELAPGDPSADEGVLFHYPY